MISKLNKTLFIQENCSIRLSENNIVVSRNKETVAKIPLINLSAVFVFGFVSVSGKVLEECMARNIMVTLLTPGGKFQARISGRAHGAAYLRYRQFETFGSGKEDALELIKNTIFAKLYNSKWLIERMARQYKLRVDYEKLKNASQELSSLMKKVLQAEDKDEIRGLEGRGAKVYFDCWSELVINQKEDFEFGKRSKRPPMNYTNALLSFAYSLLTSRVESACETANLDPYIGFNHTLRSGRAALALDLVEELRSVVADRFVLSLINKRIISPSDFNVQETGACILNESGRRKFISHWNDRMEEPLTHPFLLEKTCWGLIPFIQADLLASYLRGELDGYPPFHWK